MSGPSEAGAPSDGVVRNSALSFVAQAQGNETGQEGEIAQGEPLVPAMPLGLKALCEVYSRLYPDQPNPLQVTTRLKYWLGGQDPLDYISMYWNPGKPDELIPPHWHYVTFGLSDLHGDGRVHPPPDRVLLAAGQPTPSGVGCELTFRLEAPRKAAPLWPAALLQALARYLLVTGNKFVSGDHISWHAPLDGAASRVRHLLVADDAQLSAMDTPHGSVSFLQMVGCTSRELRSAQRNSGFDVLKLMSEPLEEQSSSPAALSPDMEQQIKETLQRGLSAMSSDRTGPEGHTGMSTDSFEMSSIERALPHMPELMQGSWRCEETIEYLDGVHLFLNAEGASLLPLAIDGRVSHGRHFTWRAGARAITMLSHTVAGPFVNVLTPYGVKGNWLQVLIPKELSQLISHDLFKCNLSRLADTDSETDSEGERDSTPPTVPLTLAWPKYRLKISVVHDQELF